MIFFNGTSSLFSFTYGMFRRIARTPYAFLSFSFPHSPATLLLLNILVFTKSSSKCKCVSHTTHA